MVIGPKGKEIHSQDIFPGAMCIDEKEREEILDVLEGRSFFRYYGIDLKGKVETFENEFKAKMEVANALGVSSGTGALFVALQALGVGPGDEVIVPGYTFIASMEVIPAAKAIPVICDIDESLNIDPEDFERKITDRTKAVIVVHMRGTPVDMDRIMAIAKKHHVMVLEDCAQAAGVTYKGRRVGTIGDIGAYSLQYHKIITSGEGGVVATNNRELFERAVRLHDHGYQRFTEYGAEESVDSTMYLGLNFRMSELAGAIACAQLRKLDDILNMMRRNKKEIVDAISDIEGITPRKGNDPNGEAGSTIVFFTDSEEKTRKFTQGLKERGVAAYVPYDSGPHVYSHWRQLLEKAVVSKNVKCPFECPYYTGNVEYKKDMLPKTDNILKRAIHMDISPIQTSETNQKIAQAVRDTAVEVL